MNMNIYIYTNYLPVNTIVRLPHPWNGDSQGQILVSSAFNQTHF